MNSCDWASIGVNGSQLILIITALNSLVSQKNKNKNKKPEAQKEVLGR